ncbi:MAG: glycosyltransferase family 87 protein [Phycisphaerae bacterium]
MMATSFHANSMDDDVAKFRRRRDKAAAKSLCVGFRQAPPGGWDPIIEVLSVSNTAVHPGPFDPLGKIERFGLIALLIGVFVFGCVTEVRSAFLKRRMTDVDTYFRAAWAVRVHKDPYNVTDTNGWHYNYPPLLATLLYPLADAPAKFTRAGLLPYSVSVAIWFLISIGCIGWGIHVLAAALEKTSTDPAVRNMPRFCRRWWALRIIPLLVCLPAIGRAVVRGQVDSELLMLFCFAGAALATRKQFWAGFANGIAAALKIFPGFLVLYGLSRLRWKYLAGMAAALVVGLFVIPGIIMGPRHMVVGYCRFTQVMLAPALGLNGNTSRDKELFDINKTDSNSFEAMIDHTVYFNRSAPAPVLWMKMAHWGISAVLVALTLLIERLSRKDDPIYRNLFLGVLITVMMPIVPICHPHYYCMVLPLVMALLAARWERDRRLPLGGPLGWVLLFFTVSHILTVLPAFHILRGLGLVTYSALTLWAAGLVVMWHWKTPQELAPASATESTDFSGGDHKARNGA